MTTTPAKPAAAPGEFCGAFPGLSAAGSRVPCTASECPTEGICRALRRLDREAGLARATRDAATRYVEELLEATAEGSKTAARTTTARRRGGTPG